MSFEFFSSRRREINLRNGRYQGGKCCANETCRDFSGTPGGREVRQVGRGMNNEMFLPQKKKICFEACF